MDLEEIPSQQSSKGSQEDEDEKKEQVFTYSRQAASLSDVNSIRWIADHTEDPKEALDWYMKAAKAGNISSYLICANTLYHGSKDVDRNVDLALEYYIMAARIVSRPSIAQVAYCINEGDSYVGLKPDSDRAFELFTEGASTGCARSFKELGDANWFGTKTAIDHEAAQEYYERAVNAGLDEAIPCLARCLWKTKDARAKELMRKFILIMNGDCGVIPEDVIETILDEI